MPTSYEAVYEGSLSKFRSYEIAEMSEEEVKEQLHDYLDAAISKFHVCRKDLSDRDDILERFNCDLNLVEIEILANFCLIEYIDSNYVRIGSVMKMNLTSTDFKACSQANLLEKLMAMRSKYLSENEGLLSRYAWMGLKESGISLGSGYKKNKNKFMF